MLPFHLPPSSCRAADTKKWASVTATRLQASGGEDSPNQGRTAHGRCRFGRAQHRWVHWLKLMFQMHMVVVSASVEGSATGIRQLLMSMSDGTRRLSPVVCQVVDEAGLTVPEELKSCTTPEANDQSKLKEREGLLEVYIKWESGNLIKGLKLLPTACLLDLRKLVQAHFEESRIKKQQQNHHHHQFTFLLLGDPSGALVSREKEPSVQISKLPNWNNQTNSYLACLRAVKKPRRISSTRYRSAHWRASSTPP